MNEMKHTAFSATASTFVPLCAIPASFDAAMVGGDTGKGGGICEAGPIASHGWRYVPAPAYEADPGTDDAVGSQTGPRMRGDGVTGNARMMGAIALITITLAAVFCGCSEEAKAR